VSSCSSSPPIPPSRSAPRSAVSVRAELTEQQQAGIEIDVATAYGDGHYGAWRQCRREEHARVDESVPALADAVRWARSVNPLRRRRAARHPGLPAELVTVLAGDPDLGVRVLLARLHPQAPPALLLRCFLGYQGCGRGQLAELPQFPAEGLAAFAEHTDPAVRRLVARDPHADPDLVDRLCTDPDGAVRQAMAASPRLPVARITALLDDPDLAGHAAANPALPVDLMRRILRHAA
jgi:hypothetical protein